MHVADQPPRQLICTDNEGDLLTSQQSTPSSSPSSQTLAFSTPMRRTEGGGCRLINLIIRGWYLHTHYGIGVDLMSGMAEKNTLRQTSLRSSHTGIINTQAR